MFSLETIEPKVNACAKDHTHIYDSKNEVGEQTEQSMAASNCREMVFF